MKRIPLWVDLREVPVNKRLPYWKAIKAADADAVLLGREDPHLEKEGYDIVLCDGRNTLKRDGDPIGRYIKMRGGKDQKRAADVEGIVIIEAEKWSIIPLENLIAERRSQQGTLFALAKDPEEAVRFRDTLEIGVHGVVLAPEGPSAIGKTHELLVERGPRKDDTPPTVAEYVGGANGATPHEQAAPAAVTTPKPDEPSGAPAAEDDDKLSLRDIDELQDLADDPRPTDLGDVEEQVEEGFLEEAKITLVADAGPGDRVCVDCTSVFRPGEGLLVGSTARSFVLVHAETIESEFVNARPFRVNAGAVHMYLYAPEGRTNYLSELEAGAKVLAIHPDGVHRAMTVGRAKIERRPHTLIQWQTKKGRTGSAVLQTAETIRVVTPKGPVSVTELKGNETILVHMETAARHFGMAVEASLREV